MSYDVIKKNYDRGLWSKMMVRFAVGTIITAEQYEQITGEAY